jgi:hypothetical protein
MMMAVGRSADDLMTRFNCDYVPKEDHVLSAHLWTKYPVAQALSGLKLPRKYTPSSIACERVYRSMSMNLS